MKIDQHFFDDLNMQANSDVSKSRAAKGSVVVDSLRGRLRLRLPRSLYSEQQAKYISVQIDDNPENREIAEAKARQAELDIKSGNFDFSWNKYRIFNHLTVLSSFKEEKPQAALSLTELWEKYIVYKTPICSPKTIIDSYVPMGRHFAPYNCRDTFITLQALQGNSSDTIARWVGNTPEVIQKHYMGKLALEHLKPTDI